MNPVSLLFADSAWNRIPIEIRRKASFYAPLTDHLHYYGVDGLTFVRAADSMARQRSGLDVAIGSNVPRFEYAGEDRPLGIRILDPFLETLTFPPANNLHDAGHLFWVENGSLHHAPDDAVNPFSPSGVFLAGAGTAVRDVLKFPLGVTLTAEEIFKIKKYLDMNQRRFGRIFVGHETLQINVEHNLNHPDVTVDGATEWNADFYVVSETDNIKTLAFTDQAPIAGGYFHWGARV